ncbi:tRNA pseudouridine(38-40) synthase TruA [Clostridium manihotivorum]|uniref:tRNA pseudouridine synthase A n=1 Tax=Clostridium manihotivorum TaxID=2320868 RepID=A0A3R5QWX3_9CLOT|nr:tRNA pseudouridine(38-40) synthase TruA [Clostridium manihotivorum]QAA34549.1 tRNA pseudouridine(38-40) synthase TruA [Clostridium manihotivorum]
MQNYKMMIAYDGRKYIGYNKSKDNAEKSIEGKLEAILSKLYEKDIEVIGAINTDAGVHAKGQIVNFIAPDNKLSEKEIFDYFEKYLTDDIIILSVEAVDERFHSRYLMKSATYEYRLWKKDAPNRPLFERHYVHLMNQTINVAKSKEAAKYLVGEHDFLAFTTNKKTKKSVKKILSLDISETKNEIIIIITANGFLLNMERIIVGTLIQVGIGQLPVNTIEKAFKSRDMNDVGHKASADALCLLSIQY